MSERKSTNKWTFERSRQARLKLWEFLATPQSELDHPGRAHKLLKNAARLGIQLVDALESHRAELDDRDAAIQAFLSTKITFEDTMTFLKYLELLQKTGNSQPKAIPQEDGVAQRVITELNYGRGDVLEAGWIAGARYLRDELSAEARRVLAEWDKNFHASVDSRDGLTADMSHLIWMELRQVFTRLGLDLNEPEDSDE